MPAVCHARKARVSGYAGRMSSITHSLAQAPGDWLRPDWPAPAAVQALCSTRHGGVSQPPFDSLNLGNHVGDEPDAVATNRVRLQAALGGPRPVFLRQIHGMHCQGLAATTPDELEADACSSSTPGIACTIMVADCLPVLLCNRQGTRVAAAHAGWRGLAGGVLESALAAFQDDAGHNVMAWLGPCIGPQAFEVGAEVHAAFCAHDAQAAACFTAAPGGKFFANLPALARQRLVAAGVTQIYGNDASPDWCTVSNASRFFSHRRDSALLGGSGRMAACIWLVA